MSSFDNSTGDTTPRADHLLHLRLVGYRSKDSGDICDPAEPHWSFTCEHADDDPEWVDSNSKCWLMDAWRHAEMDSLSADGDWPDNPKFPLPVKPSQARSLNYHDEIWISFDPTAH